jgi:hypothetical protein
MCIVSFNRSAHRNAVHVGEVNGVFKYHLLH